MESPCEPRGRDLSSPDQGRGGAASSRAESSSWERVSPHPRCWVRHPCPRFSLQAPKRRPGPRPQGHFRAKSHTWAGLRARGAPYLHILGIVDLWGPVWDAPHAALPVAELLAEGPVLGLGVPAAVGVVEGDIQEEGPARGGSSVPGPGVRPRGAPPSGRSPSASPAPVTESLLRASRPQFPQGPLPLTRFT